MKISHLRTTNNVFASTPVEKPSSVVTSHEKFPERLNSTFRNTT